MLDQDQYGGSPTSAHLTARPARSRAGRRARNRPAAASPSSARQCRSGQGRQLPMRAQQLVLLRGIALRCRARASPVCLDNEQPPGLASSLPAVVYALWATRGR